MMEDMTMQVKNLNNYTILRDGKEIHLTLDEIETIVSLYEKDAHDDRLIFIMEELECQFEDISYEDCPEEARDNAIRRIANEILEEVEDGETTLEEAIEDWNSYIPFFIDEDLE